MQSPSFSLAGRVAAVTGGSRGIGRAIAVALARAGAAVALLGRDRPSLIQAQQAITDGGGRATHLCAAISQICALDALFNQIGDWLGRLDILINNAGVEQVCPSLDASEDLWDRVVGTNLKGSFFCAQAAARHMQAGGSIVNLCSLTSQRGVPGAAAYGASKSGLAGLTRTLATEWASRMIRVNGIGPGYFRTALTEPFYADAAWQSRTLEKIPLRRFGQLDELGGAAVFLCSDAASYITGQILYVDGGYLASI